MWPGEGRRGFKMGEKLTQVLGSAASFGGQEVRGRQYSEEHTPK